MRQQRTPSKQARRRPVKNHPGIYVRETASGKRYEIVYRDETGRQRWEVAGSRLEDAETLREEKRSRKRKGQPLPRRDTRTFAEYSEAWLERQHELAPRTREDYERRLSRVRSIIGHLRLQDVGLDALRVVIRKLSEDYAPLTVKNTLAPFRLCLSDAVRDGLIASHPFALLDRRRELPKAKKRSPRVLSDEERTRLLDSASSTRYRLLLSAYVYGGLRLMEGLGLVWSDVDTKARTIRVQAQLSRKPGEGRIPPKTDEAKREIAIPDGLAAQLREYRAASIFSADTDYVFCTDSGKPLGWSNVHRHALGAAVKRAKLHAPQPTIHDLRHTYASMLIADGADVEYVRGQLGHTDAATTLRIYTHSFNQARAESESRAKMNARFGNTLETVHPVTSVSSESGEVVELADYQDSSTAEGTG